MTQIMSKWREVLALSKMSSNIQAKDEELDSDESDNPGKLSSSDVTQAKTKFYKLWIKKVENSLIFVAWKIIMESLILSAVLFYFFYSHYLDEEETYNYLLIPVAWLELILMIFLVAPKCFRKGIIQVFEKCKTIVQGIVLCLTLSFDIYEAVTEYSDRIHLLVGIARWLRVILFYVILNDFLFILQEKWRNNVKKELTAIRRIPNIEALLKHLILKFSGKSKVLKYGLSRAMILARKLMNKSKNRNQLNDISFGSEKDEDEISEFREISKKDIKKKMENLKEKQDTFFNEVFDFVSMEHEYSLKMILESARDLEFDIFDLESKSDGNELYLLWMHLMYKEEYVKDFRISHKKLRNFAYAVQSSYNDITYHNKTHASDVCQTSYYFMFTWDFVSVTKYDRLEQMSMLLAGLVHDTGHPGYNNLFMINTHAPLAVRYNDIAVLENYHAAMAFKIMLSHKDCNIFDNLSKEEFTKARKSMLQLVLATDMARHFGDMNKFKARIGSENFDPSGEDKKLTEEFIFHMADISNPTKPWPLCKKWTDLLFIEFFQQGDKERELGIDISFLMDRTTTNVAKAQDGFINNLIKPAFSLLEQMLPQISLNIKYMDENLEKWATKVVQYSVMTHSHLETAKSKKVPAKDEEDKSSDSECSIMKAGEKRGNS